MKQRTHMESKILHTDVPTISRVRTAHSSASFRTKIEAMEKAPPRAHKTQHWMFPRDYEASSEMGYPFICPHTEEISWLKGQGTQNIKWSCLILKATPSPANKVTDLHCLSPKVVWKGDGPDLIHIWLKKSRGRWPLGPHCFAEKDPGTFP